MARIELWNGDICDLEVDAIVNAANLSLWMSTGVGGEIKRAGGDAIEFAAVRQAPVPARRGDRHARPAGSPARAVIHAVSLDRDRRTNGRRSSTRPSAARWPAPASIRARASRSRPWAPASAASRSTRPRASPSAPSATSWRARPTIEHVIFAMRGAAAYHAFEAALAAIAPPTAGAPGAGPARAGAISA